MKASELAARLQKIIGKYGDMDVVVENDEWGVEISIDSVAIFSGGIDSFQGFGQSYTDGQFRAVLGSWEDTMGNTDALLKELEK